MALNLARGRMLLPRARPILLRSLSFPAHEVVTMPALSPTMEQGNLASWSIGEGDTFEAGSVLAEVETDKATVDFEAVDDGVLAKILVPGGTNDVSVGMAIAVTVEDVADVAAFASFTAADAGGAAGASPSGPAEPAPVSGPAAGETSESAGAAASSESVRLSPAARHLLESYGVDAVSVVPTGPKGIVSKADALNAVSGKSLAPVPAPSAAAAAVSMAVAPAAEPTAAAPAPAAAMPARPLPQGEYTDTPFTNMRKVISARLTKSKRDVPHFYASAECEIDALLKVRKQLKADLGVAPSLNDFVIRAVALSLADVPEMNTQIGSDGVSKVAGESIDVSVAVATPSGLITPIVTNADQKSPMQISADMRDLAGRAKINKLKPTEYQGGCFTISNLGMFGSVTDFTAIINDPHAAIMAVGGSEKRFVAPPAGDGPDPELIPISELQAATYMTVALSCDRRTVSENTAAIFLACFRQYMASPTMMMA